MAKCPALQTNLPASLLYSNLSSSFRVPSEITGFNFETSAMFSLFVYSIFAFSE